jgi:ribose transport system substrate-binding protein
MSFLKKRALLPLLIVTMFVLGLAQVDAISNESYIYVLPLTSLPYFAPAIDAFKLAGQELGVNTQIMGPPDYNVQELVNAMETAIVKKPKGIVICAVDTSLSALIDKASEMGIPVITEDQDLPCKRLAFVGTSNHNAGVVGGENLAQLIGKKGEVAILTRIGTPGLDARVQGYKDALAKYPEIHIVQVADTRSDAQVAAQAAASILQKYPNLKGIACVEAVGGSGVSTALREANKVGKIVTMAMDREPETIEAIKDGLITATVVQRTADMTYWALYLLYSYNHSKLQISNNDKAAGISVLPVNVDTGTLILDKDNLNYFMKQ